MSGRKKSLSERGGDLLAAIEIDKTATSARPPIAATVLPSSPLPKKPAYAIDAQSAAPVEYDLGALALLAREHAYAPYSNYRVGAALRSRDGRIFTGANVENASYGLAICAERSAVVAAVMAGVRDLAEVAVATSSSPPVAPCGMCRQTLAEFSHDLVVLLVNDRGERVLSSIDELLPRAFRSDDLLAKAAKTPETL